jgi:hypothetical protein
MIVAPLTINPERAQAGSARHLEMPRGKIDEKQRRQQQEPLIRLSSYRTLICCQLPYFSPEIVN